MDNQCVERKKWCVPDAKENETTTNEKGRTTESGKGEGEGEWKRHYLDSVSIYTTRRGSDKQPLFSSQGHRTAQSHHATVPSASRSASRPRGQATVLNWGNNCVTAFPAIVRIDSVSSCRHGPFVATITKVGLFPEDCHPDKGPLKRIGGGAARLGREQ